MSESKVLHVRDVMTHTPRCLPQQYSLVEAYGWLMAEGVRGAPVLDPDGKLAGVVSNSDLLMTLAPVLDPQGDVDAETLQELRNLPLAKLIEQRPVTCGADLTLHDACELMLRRRVRRLVVCDPDEQGGKVVGVLSAIDVVYAYARGHEGKGD